MSYIPSTCDIKKFENVCLIPGANPTLRDNGRGLRADQWARFCGRYVCADVIEKHARQRLLERSTSYGNWGGENEMGAKMLLGKVIPVPQTPQQTSHGQYYYDVITLQVREILCKTN